MLNQTRSCLAPNKAARTGGPGWDPGAGAAASLALQLRAPHLSREEDGGEEEMKARLAPELRLTSLPPSRKLWARFLSLAGGQPDTPFSWGPVPASLSREHF